MDTRKISLTIALAALCVATNYAMSGISNVKFMDLIVFVSGFAFGPAIGAAVGAGSWTIYGAVNPNGFSLPIWITTMFTETLFGIAGALMRRITGETSKIAVGKSDFVAVSLLLAAAGMLLTLAYDIVTNVVWGYVAGPDVLTAVIVGFVPFGIIHMVSNALFFGTCGLSAVKAITKVYGG